MLIRRQRVVLRSSVRSRRRKAAVAVLVLGGLALLGAHSVRDQLRRGRSPWRLVPSPRLRALSVAGVGSPERETAAALFRDWVGAPLTAPDAVEARERLAAAAPGLRLEGLERNWLLRSLTVRVAVRRAMAVCADAKRAGVLLDDAGEIFEGKGAGELPVAEGGCASAREPKARQALAEFLKGWEAGGPQGLALKSVRAADGGWDLELEDGTRVRWGGAEATALKQRRLRSVLEDGQRRFGGVRSADLRFFDQGKVLVVPAK